uniref:Uncharacterized protein MANES_04G163300 n=1 Tax=Rhizophora mucronata TaxID=61149 RepID=A0A2P2JJT9_RHIMU
MLRRRHLLPRSSDTANITRLRTGLRRNKAASFHDLRPPHRAVFGNTTPTKTPATAARQLLQ